MKERPALFNGAMVRAILEGRKTQTRRVMKVQPPAACDRLARVMSSTDRKCEDRLHWVKVDDSGVGVVASDERYFDCPYGVVGDRLWVRETWAPFHVGQKLAEACPVDDVDDADAARYAADGRVWTCGDNGAEAPADDGSWNYAPHRWRPSIHMPRWASRITLEVTGVRVERLNDISEADALAEGVEPSLSPPGFSVMVEDGGCFWQHADNPRGVPAVGDEAMGQRVVHVQPTPAKALTTAKERFTGLWLSINGAGSWAANPWVWVIEFKAVTP